VVRLRAGQESELSRLICLFSLLLLINSRKSPRPSGTVRVHPRSTRFGFDSPGGRGSEYGFRMGRWSWRTGSVRGDWRAPILSPDRPRGRRGRSSCHMGRSRSYCDIRAADCDGTGLPRRIAEQLARGLVGTAPIGCSSTPSSGLHV
jgi:hypothetical protein